MKIRDGFVSNSSSSSFCVYGISVDINDLVTRFLGETFVDGERPGCEHNFDRDKLNYCPECDEEAYVEIESWETYDALAEKIQELGFDFISVGECSEETYIGFDIPDAWDPDPKIFEETKNKLSKFFKGKPLIYSGMFYSY